MASKNSGATVPTSTTKVAVRRIRLLPSKKASRDTGLKPLLLVRAEERNANRVSAPPATTLRKARIKVPRSGSLAKACTEVSTPERTRKVPSRLSEKAMMASNTVQARNMLRFSVTAREWIRAVPASQGNNEAFSTGSQNHQPPQPSS